MLKSTGLQRVGHDLVTEQQQNMRLTLKFLKNELLGIFTLEDTCLLGKCDLRVIICPHNSKFMCCLKLTFKRNKNGSHLTYG